MERGHVEGHCRGIHLVAERGVTGECYHVAGTAELTNRELTGLLLDGLGADWSHVERVADRKGHDFRYSLSDKKLRALGYTPEVSFAQGSASTVGWYRSHPDWWGPLVGDR
ncbi:hypothetical protein [Streptomyces sp. bgisy130]|uniref:hypothetical protein n=1 Tax=Streptomyces sp. bgisy130 TaxID=3413788 RepID=UPI003F4A1BB7